MRTASFKHSLLSVDVDVGMYVDGYVHYVRIFEAKYLGN